MPTRDDLARIAEAPPDERALKGSAPTGAAGTAAIAEAPPDERALKGVTLAAPGAKFDLLQRHRPTRGH